MFFIFFTFLLKFRPALFKQILQNFTGQLSFTVGLVQKEVHVYLFNRVIYHINELYYVYCVTCLSSHYLMFIVWYLMFII
jgi:hypothetical protein